MERATKISSDLIDRIALASLDELVQMAKCGELAVLTCYCDPSVRRLHEAFYTLLPSTAMREAILRLACGLKCGLDNIAIPATPMPSSGMNAKIADICARSGQPPESYYDLWTSAGQVCQPILTGREVGQLEWCGILIAYVLNLAGFSDVRWKLVDGLQPEQPLVHVGSIELRQYDVVIENTQPYHHQLVTSSSESTLQILEGNTPSIACRTVDRGEYQRNHKDWVLYRRSSP